MTVNGAVFHRFIRQCALPNRVGEMTNGTRNMQKSFSRESATFGVSTRTHTHLLARRQTHTQY